MEITTGMLTDPEGQPIPPLIAERICGAISAVRRAILDEGRCPPHHRRILHKHRSEWPALWLALEQLLTATDPEDEGDHLILSVIGRDTDLAFDKARGIFRGPSPLTDEPGAEIKVYLMTEVFHCETTGVYGDVLDYICAKLPVTREEAHAMLDREEWRG